MTEEHFDTIQEGTNVSFQMTTKRGACQSHTSLVPI